MDANKLRVLNKIEYRIPACCETCRHSDLSADGWGYCNRHTYNHEKHNEEVSRLSIHRTGSCEDHGLDKAKAAAMGLGYFEQFMIPPSAR